MIQLFSHVKVANIDKPDLCTLPPHTYLLMSVYFLQRLNPPVLPVLHEILGPKKPSRSAKVSLCRPDQTTETKVTTPKAEAIERKETGASDESDEFSEPDEPSDHECAEEKKFFEDFSVFQRKLREYVKFKFKMNSIFFNV